jgi:hypothetical protein
MLAQTSRLLFATVAVALLIAGCGGGSDTTSSLTKAEFIKQADAICEQTDETVLAGMKQAAKLGVGKQKLSPKQEKALVLLGLTSVRKEAEELAELGAPSGDEAQIAAIVKGIETAVTEAEREPINNLGSSFTEVNKMAAKYGFKGCSEPL